MWTVILSEVKDLFHDINFIRKIPHSVRNDKKEKKTVILSACRQANAPQNDIRKKCR